VKIVLPLPPFCPDGVACHHDFTSVTRWVKTSQSLCQSEMYIGDRRDHYLASLDRNTNSLVDVQMRLTGDCSGQPNTEIIAPPLDIKNGFGHDQLL